MIHKTIKGFRLPIIMMLALCLTIAVGSGEALRGVAADTAQGNDEAMIRAALLQNVIGFEHNDIAAVSKVWADDESVTVFEQGHANYGWADYRDNHLVPEMKEMKNTKYALSDIKIKVAGMTAWTTFKYTISADLKDRHVEGGGLGTAVLEKRDGRWVIVHWHSSAPRRAPVAPAPKPSK